MEYEQVGGTVDAIKRGDDDAYAKLMAHEADALRVAERVSDDRRDEAVRASSLWNTPVSSLFKEYAAFVQQVYTLSMEGDQRALLDRISTPDGLIGGGLTVLIVLLLLALLRA